VNNLDSATTFRAALELFEAAALEQRVERQLAESRVAKLKAAAELEHAGRVHEANTILNEVCAEQAQAFGDDPRDRRMEE
jgi:hypothetical protein